MKKFKLHLTESEEKIAFHMAKNPGHEDFLNNHLSDNRHVRSKYLDWTANRLKGDSDTIGDPHKLGAAIDYFHKAKQQPGFTANKDINSYSTHKNFMETMTKHAQDEPISDKESDYTHPDNTVVSNNKGLKITQIGSQDAAKQTRACFDNSWCTTQKGENPHYNEYHSLHMYEYRHPETGEIERYMSGKSRDNSLYNNTEFKDVSNKDPEKIHDNLKDMLYQHGPYGIKGDIRFATKDNLQKNHIDTLSSKTSPYDLTHIADHLPEHHKALIDYMSSPQGMKHRINPFDKRMLLSTLAGNKEVHSHIIKNMHRDHINQMQSVLYDKAENKDKMAKDIYGRLGKDSIPEIRDHPANMTLVDKIKNKVKKKSSDD